MSQSVKKTSKKIVYGSLSHASDNQPSRIGISKNSLTISFVPLSAFHNEESVGLCKYRVERRIATEKKTL